MNSSLLYSFSRTAFKIPLPQMVKPKKKKLKPTWFSTCFFCYTQWNMIISTKILLFNKNTLCMSLSSCLVLIRPISCERRRPGTTKPFVLGLQSDSEDILYYTLNLITSVILYLSFTNVFHVSYSFTCYKSFTLSLKLYGMLSKPWVFKWVIIEWACKVSQENTALRTQNMDLL